jgi:hypothetical protein
VKHMATQQTLVHANTQGAGIRLIKTTDETVGLADSGNVVQVSSKTAATTVLLEDPATCPGCRLSLLIVDKTNDITIGSAAAGKQGVIMMSVFEEADALSSSGAFVLDKDNIDVADRVDLWNNGTQWYGSFISGYAT